MCLEQKCEAIVVEQRGEHISLVTFSNEDKKDWSKCVNASLVADGLARMSISEAMEETMPKEVENWYSLEETAKEEQYGIWEYGGDASESD